MKCTRTVVTILALFWVFTGSAEAASLYHVTPRVIDREVDQRDLFTETITIENLSTHKITVFPSVNEITTDARGDITTFVEPSMIEDKASSITSWISISRKGQEIMPGEIVEIPLSFRIHQDAPAGNYQALIGFGSGTNRPEAERLVRNGQAPSVIVTLAVAQNQTEFLRLGRFMVDKFVTGADNEAISYTLTNPGEATVVPTGEVIFYNSRGEEVGAVPVNPNADSLAPGQETTYTTAAPTEGFLGKYKAFLSVDYGSEQVASVYDTVFFYVLPWPQLLAAFLFVLLVAIAATVYLSRRFNGGAAEDDDGAAYLPLHVFEGRSPDQDHDINLKT